jgi:hypothetical protein
LPKRTTGFIGLGRCQCESHDAKPPCYWQALERQPIRGSCSRQLHAPPSRHFGGSPRVRAAGYLGAPARP